jgi:lipid-A-disaccharide synthase
MRLGMVAGETSGDLLASLLMRGLHERWSPVEAFGIGGPRMIEQGFDAWWPSDRLAVHGS